MLFGDGPFSYDGSQSWDGSYQVSTAVGAAPVPGVAVEIDVWTDGSAVDNGLEVCSAGAAWSTVSHISACASLQGLPLSNNVAEVAAVIMALMSWPSGPLHIHTDSSFVLRLVRGGLLALERDGWPGFPWVSVSSAPAPAWMLHLFQFLLFLLRSHAGPLQFSWVKAHANDVMNNTVDALAKEGLASSPVFHLDDLHVPPPAGSTLPLSSTANPLPSSLRPWSRTCPPLHCYPPRWPPSVIDGQFSLADRSTPE